MAVAKEQHIKQHLEKALEAIDKIASEVKEEDPVLWAEIMVARAIASGNQDDLVAIGVAIAEMNHGRIRDEAVVVIAEKLARANMSARARDLVMSTSFSTSFWGAVACARIGRHSRQQIDFGNARRFARDIHNKERFDDVLFEIDLYQYQPELANEEDGGIVQDDLEELVMILVEKGGVEGAFEMVEYISVEARRAKAMACFAKLLANSLNR
jgi:hypothetical protein